MKAGLRHTELDPLVRLVHHRWNIPVIAELHRLSGAKFVTLVHHLSVSRSSLAISLDDLIDLGLVERNTGHGHPMRPEYLLTSEGAAIGHDCLSLLKIARRRGEVDLAFRKWTIPLVATIADQRLRFSDVRTALHDATPRAITSSLKLLREENWVARKLIDDYPPTAGYELRPKGQRILTCVGSLCR